MEYDILEQSDWSEGRMTSTDEKVPTLSSIDDAETKNVQRLGS